MTPSIDHAHYELNREITAIGGHYAFLKEGILPYGNQTVLYYVGYAVVSSSCCGMGGVSYARVPGFVHALKYKVDDSGASISSLKPIIDPSIQKQISKMIQAKESIHQVEFLIQPQRCSYGVKFERR